MGYIQLPDMIYNEKEADPFDLIQQFYDMTSLPHIKGQLNDIIIAAFTGKQAKWIVVNPAILLSKYEQFHWLIIACHLFNKEKFFLTHEKNYSEKTIKKIKQHVKPFYENGGRDEYIWQHYPHFMTKEEMSMPFCVIRDAFLQFTFNDWKGFLNDAIYSALNRKGDDIWKEIENALPCFIYLHKLMEATYLIYAEETNFGRTDN